MAPSASASLDWLVRRPIAHRGLHDAKAGICENSLPAARAAMAGDFAIECDVMLSKDGVPIVFHDETLERLTDAKGPVGDRPAAELCALTLAGTEARIPTVAEFLAFIDGAVPIVMEMKGLTPEEDRAFMARLAPVLADYRGHLALMSFAPWLIDQALGAATHAVGLTAEGSSETELAAHRTVYERGCRFASYHVKELPNDFTQWVRESKGDAVITWTVREPADIEATFRHADQMTFEGFLPRL